MGDSAHTVNDSENNLAVDLESETEESEDLGSDKAATTGGQN